jgi:hypothetical protein
MFWKKIKGICEQRHSKDKLYFFLINGKIVLVDADCAREAILPRFFRRTTARINTERIINDSQLRRKKERKTLMISLVDPFFRLPSAVFVGGGI